MTLASATGQTLEDFQLSRLTRFAALYRCVNLHFFTPCPA
jgi:hypothetical protein